MEVSGHTFWAGSQTQASLVSVICSAKNEVNGALILIWLLVPVHELLWEPFMWWVSTAFQGFLAMVPSKPHLHTAQGWCRKMPIMCCWVKKQKVEQYV